MIYRKTSNISRTKSKKYFFSSRLAVAFAQSIEANCLVGNEDVVWAVPTDAAPTTSEWSTDLLPTEECTYIRGLTVLLISFRMFSPYLPQLRSVMAEAGITDMDM